MKWLDAITAVRGGGTQAGINESLSQNTAFHLKA